MEIHPPDTLFGLYQGVPLTERSWDYGNRMPDRIVIYQRPIEQACQGDADAVFEEVCATIIHEAGHYFGLLGRGDPGDRGTMVEWRRVRRR